MGAIDSNHNTSGSSGQFSGPASAVDTAQELKPQPAKREKRKANMKRDSVSKSARVCERVWVGIIFAALMALAGCSSGSAPVSVSLTPSAAQAVDQGQTVSLTAAVAHDSSNGGVTWTLSGPGALTNQGTTSATYSANGTTGAATVTATSVKDTTKTASVKITVTAVPAITTTTLPAGTEGTAYSATVADSGGAGTCAFTISAGSLPAGLTISSSGAISGTPTGPNGTANFTIKVTDQSSAGAQSATQALSIVVNLPAAPTITTTTLPAGTEGAAYSQQVVATGLAPLAFSVSAGSLPAGLTMSSAGLISGTPTGPTGTANFTVKVTDGSNPVQTATQALAVTVNLPAPPSITTTTLPAGTEGTAYSQTVAATGGLGTLTFSISAGSLPAGLAMDSTGKITGTPTGPNGTANFTVQVTDQSKPAQTGTKALSIAINLPPVPVIAPTTLPGGAVGTAYSQTLTVSGGLGPYTWSVSVGTLPAGLTLAGNGSTATISGTPTTLQSNVAFTIQVADTSNPSQKGTQAYTVTIAAAPPLSVTTASLPAGTVSAVYPATQLAATGGVAPYSWLLVTPGTGPLPPGLTFGTTGQITGTPTTAGTYPFTVQVTDSKSATATANLSITVSAISTACPSGNESALKGQYAFSLSGYTADGFAAVVGSFTADGKGNITAGKVDANGAQIQGNGFGVQSTAITAAGSSYTMGADNRGCATIVTPFYTFTTRFAIPPSAAGSAAGTIQEIDSVPEYFIGSGQIFQQKVTGTVTPGVWVYSQRGVYSGARLTVAGTKTVASGGTITAGEYDGNWGGFKSGLTGTYTTPDATTGRYTVTTTLSGISITRAAYQISGTQEIEVTITGQGTEILIGYVQLQSGSLTLSGKLAWFGTAAGIAQFATMTVSGSSFTGKIYEDNNGSWAATNPASPTCSFTIDASGRVVTSGASCGTSYSNGTWSYPPIFYLTGPNTGFLFGTEPSSAYASAVLGQLAPQTATAVTAGNYYFGTYEAQVWTGQGWDTATGVATAASDGSITGTEDKPRELNQPQSDTMTVNSDGTFSLESDPGVIRGLILSPTQVIWVDDASKTWTDILVFNAAPAQ